MGAENLFLFLSIIGTIILIFVLIFDKKRKTKSSEN